MRSHSQCCNAVNRVHYTGSLHYAIRQNTRTLWATGYFGHTQQAANLKATIKASEEELEVYSDDWMCVYSITLGLKSVMRWRHLEKLSIHMQNLMAVEETKSQDNAIHWERQVELSSCSISCQIAIQIYHCQEIVTVRCMPGSRDRKQTRHCFVLANANARFAPQ